MIDSLHIQELRGQEIGPWIDAIGSLRIRVFREYPYLYDGSEDYERGYLKTYAECERALVVLVRDPLGNAIGATTCLPLADESPEFKQPFEAADFDVEGILYLGESVVLPEWRGCGLGKKFFELRENHAHRLRLETATFCAVDRPADHPLRSDGYRALDGFWGSLGYCKHPELQAAFSWKQIGEAAEIPNTLTFWMKSLRP